MNNDQAPGSARATIARNAFHLVLGQVATTALAIVFSAALGRSLGARDFGVYFLVTSFATFAYVLVDWGQQYYVIREVARSPDRGSRLLGTALVLRIAGAALVTVPTGLVAWMLGYDARTCWFSVAFIVVSLPFFLAQSYGMVFRGRDDGGRLRAALPGRDHPLQARSWGSGGLVRRCQEHHGYASGAGAHPRRVRVSAAFARRGGRCRLQGGGPRRAASDPLAR